jgi:hypothetical protein
MRRWRSGATPADFKRIAPATRIYRTDEPLDPYSGVALHTVSVCELANPEVECESTAVMGPPGRVFYVSPNSFVCHAVKPQCLALAPPRACSHSARRLGAERPERRRQPGDQFSFLEGDDGMLNARAERARQGMAAETPGATAPARAVAA